MGQFACPPRAGRSSEAFRRLGTRNIDVAAELLETLPGRETRVRIGRPSRAFRMEYATAALGDVQLTRATLEGFSVTRSLGPRVQIVVPLEGLLQLSEGGRALDVAAGSGLAAVARPHERARHAVEEGVGLLLSLPVEGIARRAARITGRDHDDALLASDMLPAVDLSSPAGSALARTMRSVFAELERLDASGLGRLVVGGYEDILAELAVVALFPSVSRVFDSPAADCGPAFVRVARDHLEAHALEPVEIAELAATLGVSMRTLQENFQRYLHCSPREFVMSCRLERAHALLKAPTAHHTVTTVAHACGFSDLGHFSARYRRRFGELPSETLRQARQ